jgi:hypothetical protein
MHDKKITIRIINGLWGRDKFHYMPIDESWFRVDIQEVYMFNYPFMHLNEIVDQMILGDVVGTFALWR